MVWSVRLELELKTVYDSIGFLKLWFDLNRLKQLYYEDEKKYMLASFAPPWRGPYRAPTAQAKAVCTSTPLQTKAESTKEEFKTDSFHLSLSSIVPTLMQDDKQQL